ncbi:MAG: glycoside hydrolase family 13 protein [Christensenellaceae bacterium]
MQQIDFSKQIMHDSARQQYRSPLGAAQTGSKVRLSIAVRDIFLKQVYLTILKDNVKTHVEMSGCDGVFSTEYELPNEPCVIWYWFCIKLDEGNNIYYGPKTGYTCGPGMVYWNMPPAFQLTVYDKNFSTPNWFKNAIMYQIMPDRFMPTDDATFQKGIEAHKQKNREVRIHENWDELPYYKADEGKDYYQPNDYFGGNLKGIISSLDYLSELGVNVLYLNPIFDAASNHRYNTADYMNIDSVLGTNEDFEELTRTAKMHDIKIVLDGVFSHTGDDSVYFNRYGTYDSVGAYQSKDSPYYPWYQFSDYPDKYKSWWGFETLPEVDESNKEWQDFIIENDDSVINTWIRKGASGYRLDVADELPDEAIEKIRTEMKHLSQDNVLIGEVWEDATTKQSYGVNRTYALGRGLDSVMNYPLASAIVDFLCGRKDAFAFKQFLIGQSQNYPKEMYYSLMNLLSSHDVARIHTLLATKIDAHSLNREQQAHFVVTQEQEKEGTMLQKIAVALQFTLPGVPCIYYGDENGMNGLLDPFNRQTFKQAESELHEYYKFIANFRAKTDALKTGNCIFYSQGQDVFGLLRYCIDEKDAFGNIAKDGIYLMLFNNSYDTKNVAIDLFGCEDLTTKQDVEVFTQLDFRGAKCILTGEKFEVDSGIVQGELPAQSVRIFEIDWI